MALTFEFCLSVALQNYDLLIAIVAVQSDRTTNWQSGCSSCYISAASLSAAKKARYDAIAPIKLTNFIARKNLCYLIHVDYP
jgi:hypothetical protein